MQGNYLLGISFFVTGSNPVHDAPALSQFTQLGSLWSQRFFLMRHRLQVLIFRKLRSTDVVVSDVTCSAASLSSSAGGRGDWTTVGPRLRFDGLSIAFLRRVSMSEYSLMRVMKLVKGGQASQMFGVVKLGR
jgi:hypothetical protein